MKKIYISISMVTLMLLLPTSAVRAEESITAVSWGGTSQEALSKAFFQPATAALGVTLKEDTLNGIADVRRQVQSGAPTWDIVEVGASECIEGSKEGLFEPIDYSVVSKDGLAPSMTNSHWISDNAFTMVIAWNKDKYGENGPQSWTDFWDVKKFPGTRGLYNRPIKMLEAAILADGVAPADVYKVLAGPGGVDRAFAKLEELKPNVSVWWDTAGQAMQLAIDKELDILAIPNGRISVAIAQGANYGFTFNQGFIDWNCFAIPKGSPKVALANKVIGKMMSPEIQANLPLYIAYGPANALAFETGKISADLMKNLNTAPDNLAKQVLFDGEWWAENEPKIQERYESFLQK